MDRVRKNRVVLRRAFTRCFNHLGELLSADQKDELEVQTAFEILEKKAAELREADREIMDLLLDADAAEEDLDSEYMTADEYVSKFIKMRLSVTAHRQPRDNDVVSSANNEGRRKFKLPQIEFKKFSGDLKEWLPFWSQFCKIHEDSDIVAEDKFQYLLQATVPGSRARELVESFPPTSGNYEKVIDSIKARFGREDLLVEVYIRELLKLVLQNTIHNRGNVSLQSLYDKLESHLRALETLGVTTDKCAAMLYPLVESCMPEDLLRAWQRSSHHSGETPKDRLDNLMKFMLSEVEGEERISLAMAGFGLTTSEPNRKKRGYVQRSQEEVPTAASLVSTGDCPNMLVCIFCDKKHRSSDCFTAQKMTLFDKRKVLADKKCCYSCLKPGHHANKCKTSVKCALCSRKHLVLMCPELTVNSKDKGAPSSRTPEEGVTKQDNVLASLASCPHVFLQTAMVRIKGPGGEMSVRAIFDSGSQKSYVLDSVAAKMSYEPLGEETIVHSLFGGVRSGEHKHKRYRIHIASMDDSYRCNFEVLDQPIICGDISQVTSGPWLKELSEHGIILTDLEEQPGPISVLIGADVGGKLLTGHRVLLSSGLVAVETLLGWTLMGKVPERSVNTNLAVMVTSMFVQEADVTMLWRLDTIGISEPCEQRSKEEKALATKRHFLETVTVNDDGRYEVHLPWVDGHPPLPNNRIMAERRLSSVTRRLQVQGLLKDYDDVLREWQAEGIVEAVPENDNMPNVHYLPHRAVVKERSTTTRIRPVFDASAKEKGAPSLNDCLENGPNLIELIPSVILRFRERRWGVVADIRKAFLQISVFPQDRDFLRFLWYSNIEKKEIATFRHARVVFGVKSSPFLLAAVIDFHLQESLRNGPPCSRVIEQLRTSFYVDNVATSVDTKEELQVFIEDARCLMAAGGFDLTAWEFTGGPSNENLSELSSVLGLLWNPQTDVLSVSIECLQQIDLTCITKRTILSVAHRIFDPIGFSSPVLLCPKLILQGAWSSKIDWDSEVDGRMKTEFLRWYEELPALQHVKIPRWIGYNSSVSDRCSVHTFTDASKYAYAAVIFLRVETDSGVSVQLIAAKSRVAPLKKATIPRLELLAATVGARLTASVLDVFKWDSVPVYYWSDSTTVLAWIRREENWSVFVWNRVAEIRKLSSIEDWRHVPGEFNPADLPSRGCSANQLLKSKWWEGPAWLRRPTIEWPSEETEYNPTEVNQERKKGGPKDCMVMECLQNGEVVCEWCKTPRSESLKSTRHRCCVYFGTKWYYRYFSQYSKIVRLVAWIFRFVRNCRLPGRERQSSELTVQEIEDGERHILKCIQQESFGDERDKNITALNPYTDECGLLRLKTKVYNRDDNFDFQCPVLLPAKHPTIRALIFDAHVKHCHAGVQILLNLLREKYWILGGRKTIRSVISACIPCKRQRVKRLESLPTPLPVNRVRDAAVFEVSGVDFAGPLFLKDGQKGWICLFTCAIYRAVHLELVTSLSTDAFLQAFRRFISRRGRPRTVYSDNGTNFLGMDNALHKVDWQEIVKYGALQRIQWIFNPPTAAWWGGWWERMVRLLKELLRRVLGRARLTYQELSTVLCDCEAVINSRPLTYIFEGKEEFEPLTPAHFLQEIREAGVPDLDDINRVSLNKRLLYRQKIKDDLRHRFRKEYLGQLVHHGNTIAEKRKVAVGDIVLLGSDNSKRIDWPLARVIELMSSKDGVTRLVRVKTSHGELLRPIQRLYPLEVSNEERWALSSKSTRNQETGQRNLVVRKVEPVCTRSGRKVTLPERYTLLS